MGAFAKAKAARATGGPRQYFVPGDYLLGVAKIEFGETRKDLKIWAVEFVILEYTPRQGAPEIPPKIGSIVSWATLSGSEVFWGNIKAFTVALMSESEETFDRQVSEEAYELYCEALSGKDQKATGWHMKAGCEASENEEGETRAFPRWKGVPLDEQPTEAQETMKEMAGLLVG